MIKALRKRHLQIWTAWSVLLPVGIIGAYIAVPEKKTGKLFSAGTEQALPVVSKQADRADYSVVLRTDASSLQWQLEWKSKVASTYPSSLIYQMTNSNDIKDASIIGRVEAKGDFYFPLKPDSLKQYHFVLYDIIHQQIIDSINF